MLDQLSKTEKLKVKSCSSPMVLGVHLTRGGETFEDPERYRRLVGKLNYFIVNRHDIVHSANVVSQYMSAPTDHWLAIKHILCYLKGAPGPSILYSYHRQNRIKCFSDVHWAGSKEDKRSTSGYRVFVGGNLVSWSVKNIVLSLDRVQSLNIEQ